MAKMKVHEFKVATITTTTKLLSVLHFWVKYEYVLDFFSQDVFLICFSLISPSSFANIRSRVRPWHCLTFFLRKYYLCKIIIMVMLLYMYLLLRECVNIIYVLATQKAYIRTKRKVQI